MTPNRDAATMNQGRNGQDQGRELFENATVIATQLYGKVNSSMLIFSVEMTAAAKSCVSLIEEMPTPDPEAGCLAVHRMQRLINHADCRQYIPVTWRFF